MTKHCNNFMERVEAQIGNAKQPLFDGMKPDIVHYGAFWGTNNSDDIVLPYGEEIQDKKYAEVNEDYV